MKNIPTVFQRRTLWTAITALAITVMGALLVGLIYLTSSVLAFLQPILVPFAVAAVLAYLLNPVVNALVRWKLSRHRAVWVVFVVALIALIGFCFALRSVALQSIEFAKEVPDYVNKAQSEVLNRATEWNEWLKKRLEIDLLHWNLHQGPSSATPTGTKTTPEPEVKPSTAPTLPATAPVLTVPLSTNAAPTARPSTGAGPDAATPGGAAKEASTPTPTPKVTPEPGGRPSTVPVLPATPPVLTVPLSTNPAPSTSASAEAGADAATPDGLPKEVPAKPRKDDDEVAYRTLQDLLNGEWVKPTLSYLGLKLWGIIHSSVGGFLGIFGFLLSLVIVPLYLYYFLTESPRIAEGWAHYVPLRASQFKNEVVDTLEEINHYLIAFFRGQLVVSLINGLATGVGLVIVGLKFGWLIGLSLCLLGMIPYLGIVLCWIPAVIIASVQGGSYLVPSSPWWVFPLVVTAIFAIVQQLDGLFVTPKIVGESVGLHPMTVIVAVFAWSLVMGGLLGAILAVPLTAALKVLFQRYVWKRTMEPRFLATEADTADDGHA